MQRQRSSRPPSAASESNCSVGHTERHAAFRRQLQRRPHAALRLRLRCAAAARHERQAASANTSRERATRTGAQAAARCSRPPPRALRAHCAEASSRRTYRIRKEGGSDARAELMSRRYVVRPPRGSRSARSALRPAGVASRRASRRCWRRAREARDGESALICCGAAAARAAVPGVRPRGGPRGRRPRCATHASRDYRAELTQRANGCAVAVTCGAKGCDVDRQYHADCITTIYEKLGPKGSGSAKNRAMSLSIKNLQLSGALSLRQALASGADARASAAHRQASSACTARTRRRARAPAAAARSAPARAESTTPCG